MAKQHRIFWQESILDTKERLSESTNWFPYPCIISFFLSLLFIGHLLLGLNPRLGNPAQTIRYPAQMAEEGSIWLSVTCDSDYIYITTASRQVFTLSQKNLKNPNLDQLVAYLQTTLNSLSLSVTLSKNLTHTQSIVSIAVDQSTTYGQLRPLIFALAKAGISEFAFETKQPSNDGIKLL